jgi:hypothetical protein
MQLQKIHTKLKNTFDSKDLNGPEVVYILSKVRKILEIKNSKKQYIILNLFCDWILHSSLSYPNTIEYFKSNFEGQIEDKDSSKNIGIKILLRNRHFFVLNKFRTELSSFLEEENLPSTIIDYHWKKFIKILLGEVMECPVIINGNKIKKLSLSKDKKGGYNYNFYLNKGVAIDCKNIIKIKLKFK